MDAKTLKIKYHVLDLKRIEKTQIGDWIDLRAADYYTLMAGEFKFLSLGISVQLPEGYEAIIAPRSSTYKIFWLLQPNSPGVIDESYCGDGDVWHMPAIATKPITIKKNDRICQFRIQKKQPEIVFEEVETLYNKDRGGLGSTGVK